MIQSKNMKFRNFHLIVSVLLIFGIATTYGFSPEKIIPALADCNTQSNDLKNAFKALMGLYFGLSIFWILGIINPRYWHSATLVNILFMFGLGIGRIISLVADGIPSQGMFAGMAIELVLGIWGIISLKLFSGISK